MPQSQGLLYNKSLHKSDAFVYLVKREIPKVCGVIFFSFCYKPGYDMTRPKRLLTLSEEEDYKILNIFQSHEINKKVRRSFSMVKIPFSTSIIWNKNVIFNQKH